jgi:HD-GYP domain-containing protein (c-di-GMP phosphodiesterase class II)
MRWVPTSELEEGDRLGRSLYTRDGRLILSSGQVLTRRMIEGLARLNVDGAFIDNRRPNEVSSIRSAGHLDTLRAEAFEYVKKLFTTVADEERLEPRPVMRLANDIVRHAIEEEEQGFQLKEYRTEAAYLYAHSVNVCLLAVRTGQALRYSELQLKTLAIGALLHDIGRVSKRAVNPAVDHPRVGFDLMRRYPELPLLSAHVVLQHHEKVNGTGFPFGVQGDQFRQASQIVAVANDFDHFVNEIGQNRLPHEGIEYIMSKVDTHYDISVVRAFVKSVTPYPVGTVVRLSSGLIGTVVEMHQGHPSRPVILTKDQHLRIDLMHFPTEFIEEVIMDQRVTASGV